MTVTEELERMTVDRAQAIDIARVAAEQGMRSLRSDGFEKVLAGTTSLEEILRVVV
jgi:type IV pilus assembly protein PilB